jgi:hypothetical protein
MLFPSGELSGTPTSVGNFSFTVTATDTSAYSCSSSNSYILTIRPRITGFTPNNGTSDTTVTITGNGFTGANAVKFNGISASFTVNSDTQITATVPRGATTGLISVTTSAGIGTGAASFFIPIAITGFTPNNGTAGTSVIISGIGFTNATGVTFNTVAASFTINSNTQITAIVPTNASSGLIIVLSQYGPAKGAIGFTVLPKITGFTPNNGPAGTSITISGTGFNNVTMVKFNGTIASFTRNSSTQITATVPSGAITGPISVTTPGGTDTSPTNYTVTSQ